MTPGSLFFSPDGATLVSASGTSFVELWDVATQQLRARLPTNSAARSVAFSPDGCMLAVGLDDGFIRIFRAADPENCRVGRLVAILNIEQ